MESGWEEHAAREPLSEAEVRARIRTYAGERPVRTIEALPGGLVNQNVHVHLGDPEEDVVLRLHLRPEARSIAAKEAALLRSLPEGVPAPVVLELVQLAGQPQTVQGFVPGRSLRTFFQEAAPQALARAGREVGAALAALHACPHDQPLGLLDEHLRVPEPMGPLDRAWRSYVQAAVETGPARARLPARERAALEALLEPGAKRLRQVAAPDVLLHGDCKPTNILVASEGRLCAFLDWEFAFCGPALFDLGQMLRWPLPPAFERAFVERYEAESARLPEDWRALARVLDLVNLIGFLDGPAERPVVFRDCRRLVAETLCVLREAWDLP
jgi:aminoglycoside phosphotransferase (APT) family kinase protein